MSDTLIRMKVDMHKIDKLPELAERMMKPVEKIDSIRINQIQGLGQMGGGQGGTGSPAQGATDAILNLALQLPTMQKLGQSLGLNLDLGEAGLAAKDQPDK
jgi:flotillin